MTFYEVLVKGTMAELKSLKFEANYYAKNHHFLIQDNLTY